MRKFLFIALVLLVGTNIFLFKRLDSVRKERDRLDSNQAALLSDVEHYKTEAGKNATSVLRLELTKNEYRILQVLFEKRGKVVSRETLMQRLWETDSVVDENTLTVNVARLRKKLAGAGVEHLIETKKGIGYWIA